MKRKEISVNFRQLEAQFRREYDYLYNAPGYVAGYDEAVQAFDDFLGSSESNKKFVADFARFRGDFISSDREAAAFMFALNSLENNQ